jgi:hypothetical protein
VAYLGLGLLGVANLLGGDPLGLLYIVAALAGFLFLHHRLLAICVWLGVAVSGGAALFEGQAAGILLVGFGAALAVIGALTPNPTSSELAPGELANDDHSRPAADHPAGQDTSTARPSVDSIPVPFERPADPGPLAVPNAAQPLAASPAPKLQIRTIGVLEIRFGDQELAKTFKRRKLLGFVWLYLLSRALHSPRQPLSRTALAAEISTNLEPAAQLTKLRSQIHDLQHGLPAPLVKALLIDSDSLALDLDTCDLDVVELRLLDSACRSAGDLLSTEQQRTVEAMLLTLAPGEYLPGWEDLEHEITQGRGVAGDVVRSLRQQVDGWRANLAGSLAVSYLARREPARALAHLRDALDRCPEREDLARHLIAAYLETGQPGRAAELRREYQIPQEA